MNKYENYTNWLKEKGIICVYPKKYGYIIARSKDCAYAVLASKGRWSFPIDGIRFDSYKEAVAYASANNPNEAHRKEVAKRREKEAIALLTSLGYKITK